MMTLIQPDTKIGNMSISSSSLNDIMIAVLNGQKPFVALYDYFPDRDSATQYYANWVENHFSLRQRGSQCEVCGHSARSVVPLNWTAVVSYGLKKGLLKIIFLMPLVCISHLMVHAMGKLHQNGKCINMTSRHWVCWKCKCLLWARNVAGAAYAIMTGIILFASLACFFLAGIGIVVLLCRQTVDKKTLMDLGYVVAASLSAIAIIGTIANTELEEKILLPPVLRRIARGPFHLKPSYGTRRFMGDSS